MKSSKNQILSKHKLWDYEISLIKRIVSKKLSIYQLSLKKLQKLKDYLNNNLWKKYIQHFISKKKWKMMIVYKLLKIQQNHLKKQILIIIN